MISICTRKLIVAVAGIAAAVLLTACGQASAPVDGGAPIASPATAPAVTPPPPSGGQGAPAPVPADPATEPPPLPPPPMAAPAPAPAAPAVKPSPPPIGPAAPSSTCASAQMAAFPWPNPPQPSVVTQISFERLFAEGTANKTLLDVARRLSGAVAKAGYHQETYLGAGCNGFAIVLDLEHIEADGARKPGALGFAPPSQQPEFSLADFFVRLFHAPPGYYRQIVLIVSDEAIGPTTAAPTEGALRRLAEDGTSALPPAYAQIPLTWKYKVIAAVYEFRKGADNGDARFIPPNGRLGATVHLMKARLL